MIIQTVAIKDLKPAAYNPRKDLKPGDKEYDKLKKAIIEFGYIDPIIINKRSGNIVGGHQRLKILKELGHTETDVSVVDLDDVKEKALNLALNKTGGDWDLPKLSDLLLELDVGDIDIEITGFDNDDLERLLVDREPQIDPEKEWEGMPEFESTMKAVKTIYLHFETEQDIKIFSEFIGQKVEMDTKYIWYPKK